MAKVKQQNLTNSSTSQPEVRHNSQATKIDEQFDHHPGAQASRDEQHGVQVDRDNKKKYETKIFKSNHTMVR